MPPRQRVCRPRRRRKRCFCGNCSTSSLRRFYSPFGCAALTNRYRPSLNGKHLSGARQGGSFGRLRLSPPGERRGSHRGLPLCATTCCGFWLRWSSLRWQQPRSRSSRIRRAPSRPRRSRRSGRPLLLKQIRRYQRKTWHLQRLMGVRRSPASASPAQSERPRVPPLGAERLAQARSAHLEALDETSRRSAWMCIHRHEGVDRPEPAVLRRPANGHLVSAHLRARAAPSQGHKWTPLEADLGRAQGPPLRPRLLSVAEHCERATAV